MPAGFAWPAHDRGPHRFIGQFNLADVPAGPRLLSPGGLLSFFYAHDDDGESSWGDPDYVRAYHFDAATAVRPVEPPAAVRPGVTSGIGLVHGLDVPPWPWGERATAWPIDESRQDDYWELRLRLHPAGSTSWDTRSIPAWPTTRRPARDGARC